MSRRATLLVAFALVAATVVPAVGTGVKAQDGGPPDPSTDVVGWEDGYWHDESVAVNQSGGLNETEIDALTARSMARVEYLRGVEFESDVPVVVVSTETYRQKYDLRAGGSKLTSEWKNVRYEALMLVGEDENATAVERRTLGASVAGFYSSSDDRIVLVSPGGDRPKVSPSTLVHELVHALQEQRFGTVHDQRTNRSASRYDPATWDAERAAEGVVEGEANYVEALYRERCGEEWSCVSEPEADRDQYDRHRGVLMANYFPYSDGPPYVAHLRDEGGWSAVDEAHRDLPASSEQVIHTTDEQPKPMTYRDRARGEWSRFAAFDGNGTTTVGESSMYTMFWYRAKHDIGTWVSLQDFKSPDAEPYDIYDYNASPTDGWGNDVLVPYRKPTSNGTEHGYVWVTEWDASEDAREFETAYLEMLSARDAIERDDGLYVVSDGPYADAFRVVRNGSRVTVVNSPTVEDVEQLRPGLRPPERSSNDATEQATAGTSADRTQQATVGATASTTERATSSTTEGAIASSTSSAGTTSTATESPEGAIGTDGFDAIAAMVALVALGGVLYRRRR